MRVMGKKALCEPKLSRAGGHWQTDSMRLLSGLSEHTDSSCYTDSDPLWNRVEA